MPTGRKSLLLASIILTCGIFCSAQSLPKQASVSLLVNVLDRDGRAIRDLKKSDFRVKVNGQLVTPLDATYSVAPRRIVVLLDMSSSMAGYTDNNKWRIACETLETLLATTPADVQIALLTFSSQVNVIVDFSKGRSGVADWLKAGSTGRSNNKGRTAFFDAASQAAKIMQPRQPGDAIYAITDGGDNSSHISEKNSRTQLLLSGIRLFVFLFAERNPYEEETADSVIETARDTGGFVFGLPGRQGAWGDEYDDNNKTRDRIQLYTRDLNFLVNGFYTVGLVTSMQPGKPATVSIDIVDTSGKVRKDLTSTYTRTIIVPSG